MKPGVRTGLTVVLAIVAIPSAAIGALWHLDWAAKRHAVDFCDAIAIGLDISGPEQEAARFLVTRADSRAV